MNGYESAAYIDESQARLVAEKVSKDAGKAMEFVRFINIGKPALLFSSKDGEQRFLTKENASKLLKSITNTQ